MSSPDKVELLKTAQAAGFRTYLYFVCTESPLVNRERVAIRVNLGGHDVPAQKIEDRYGRSLGLLNAAIQNSHRSYIFDNSGDVHRLVAEFESGNLVEVARDPPAWFLTTVLNK